MGGGEECVCAAPCARLRCPAPCPTPSCLCFTPSSSWMRTAPWETCSEVSWTCPPARSVSAREGGMEERGASEPFAGLLGQRALVSACPQAPPCLPRGSACLWRVLAVQRHALLLLPAQRVPRGCGAPVCPCSLSTAEEHPGSCRGAPPARLGPAPLGQGSSDRFCRLFLFWKDLSSLPYMWSRLWSAWALLSWVQPAAPCHPSAPQSPEDGVPTWALQGTE